MNQIETFECNKTHKSLKFLFLTNNYFHEIPIDIVHLCALKHIAFDKNKIIEVDIEMFREYKNLDIKITLSENPLKIKANQKYLTKEKFDIKEIPKENMDVDNAILEKMEIKIENDNSKKKKNKKKVGFVDASASQTLKGDPSLKQEEEKKGKKEFKYSEFHYKQVQNIFEFMINERIEEECAKNSKELDNTNEENIRLYKGKEFRIRAVKNFLIHDLIEKKNEGVIGKFADMDLKQDIKEAYEKYKNEIKTNYSINASSEAAVEIKINNKDFNDHKVNAEFRKNYLRKAASNSNNLMFLKALSKTLY